MKASYLLLIAGLILSACGTGAPIGVGPQATTLPAIVPMPPGANPTPINVAALETPIPDEGHDQVQVGSQITYQHYPPASGPMYPEVIQYGLYEMDVPEGYWVHILERGGIVFLYKCGPDCSALKKELGDMLDSVPLSKHGTVKLVIVPYTNMQHLITAVAWNVQLPLDHFDLNLLTNFYVRHVDQGIEDVP
jgi:hypothetical protein